MAIMEQLTNRQDTKYAKDSCMAPRNVLGDFRNTLALFANLAVQKNSRRRPLEL